MAVRKLREWEQETELHEVKATKLRLLKREGTEMGIETGDGTGMLRDLTQEDLVKLGLDRKGKWQYTVEDIEALPEEVRAELIDGEIFVWMDAPTWTHQALLAELLMEIKLYIRKKKGKCKVIPAPFGVYIKNDKNNLVQPDISVICDEEKRSEKGCQGAPDWVIEIVSPSNKKRDYEEKLTLYREAGVREYWIVDPKKETVTVYDFDGAGTVGESKQDADGEDAEAAHAPVRYAFTERIKVGIFEDLWLNLSELDI